MSHLLAIHWIATTHGTWLHGDPRGSWHQGKRIGPDPLLESTIRRRMTRDAIVLSQEECNLVAQTIRKVCCERDHTILTMAVEPTHTHVLFAPLEEPLKTVVARLKRKASMEVWAARRKQGLQVPHTMWTKGRYVVLIDDPQHLQNTLEYIERHARGVAVHVE